MGFATPAVIPGAGKRQDQRSLLVGQPDPFYRDGCFFGGRAEKRPEGIDALEFMAARHAWIHLGAGNALHADADEILGK